jgi:uncharacterized protein YggE
MVMNHVFKHVVEFGKAFRIVTLLVAAISPTIAFGQTNRTKIHGFWVASSATVTVKPDEAVVFMIVRGSAPCAAEALAQNERVTQQVDQAIDRMGLKGKYRLSANHFSSGGAPTLAFRPYDSRGLQQPLSFEVKKYVFITFDESDLSNPAFDQILAATIDGLTRAGAQQPEMPPRLTMAQMTITGPVLFTVKDPRLPLLEAVRRATEHARALGQEVARNSGVKLAGIIDARVNRALEAPLPRQQEPNVPDELHLQYYSTSKDGVAIPATFAVEYSTK